MSSRKMEEGGSIGANERESKWFGSWECGDCGEKGEIEIPCDKEDGADQLSRKALQAHHEVCSKKRRAAGSH